MYLEHYGLKEPPFSITPDPRFVFLSERHRDALAHLLFGIQKGGGGGFVQLTGEVGTGKTTLCRLLLEQLPDDTRVALVLNPRLSPVELLETLCEESHLDLEGRRGSVKALVDALNAYLLDAYARGLRVVLIIDEAQDLSIEALEQVRLLTNLETDTQKLLQILLLGQPELRDLLAREDLRQLSQRITARFHLTPLDAAETERYLRHRYAVAGGRMLPFTPAAIRRLHVHSSGVPRLINVIAERSLLAGYARDEAMLDSRIVDLAAGEVLPKPLPRDASPRAALAAVAVVAVVLAATLALQTRQPAANAVAAVAPRAAAVTPTKRPARPAVPQLASAALTQRIAAATVSPLAGWDMLLRLWQLPTTPADLDIASQCAETLATDVYCVRGRASLDALVAIGRPVLLRLRAGGQEAWALLLGSDALRARLQLDGTMVDVARVELRAAWSGEYAAVWRAAQAPALSPADAQGVRRFQAAHGLAADGLVGPETRFALAAQQPGPRLRHPLD